MSSEHFCANRECSHAYKQHVFVACAMSGCSCSAFEERPTKGPIYVAGPMTGLPEFNFPAFDAAAERLRADGWIVENPTVNGADKSLSWDWYLRRALEQVVRCNAIALLPGWADSRGARLELDVALGLGMGVYLYVDGALVKR
jgi:hypothetical protein